MTDKQELLFDLKQMIENLNNTIQFIKTDPPREDVETCLHRDGVLLNYIRECLHNGGYDND